MVSRRSFLATCIGGLASPALADPLARSLVPRRRPLSGPTGTPPSVERLLAGAGLSGRVSFAVADAQTGQIIETANPGLKLPPASTAKALTAAYGLAHLGAGHRFGTQIVGSAPVVHGRLQGDLYLVGGGDPVVDTRGLAQLAAALKSAGLREITGRFYYDTSLLPNIRWIDETQPPHAAYNPAVSGLNLNFNRVYFEWRRAQKGWSISMDARAGQYKPRVNSARMDVVQRDFPVYTYAHSGGVDRWTVAAGALGRDGARWLPVRKPGGYAAEVFATLARSHGIVLPTPVLASAPVPPGGPVLAVHQSPPLTDILRDMLKYSTNLTAEVVGMAATAARSGQPAHGLVHSAGQMSDWAGERLGAGGARFVDHSGLGARSRISSAEMAGAMAQMAGQNALPALLKEITPRDANGNPAGNAGFRIQAKTGTLNFVSGLAGYVSPKGGRRLAFAILMADEDARAKISPQQMERPPGGRAWTRRARGLQMALINRWAERYLG